MLTNQPWWVDLSVLAGIVVSASVILRMVIWPGLRATWKAIVAAPRIAEGVGKLVELLEVDLLKRVEFVELNQVSHTNKIADHDSILSGYGARLTAHDNRLDSIELEINILKIGREEK